MKLGYAKQYQKPCIIIEEGDYADDIIYMAEEEGAIFIEGPNPEDRCVVVKFPDRPKELYTKEALRRSLPNRKVPGQKP